MNRMLCLIESSRVGVPASSWAWGSARRYRVDGWLGQPSATPGLLWNMSSGRAILTGADVTSADGERAFNRGACSPYRVLCTTQS